MTVGSCSWFLNIQAVTNTIVEVAATIVICDAAAIETLIGGHILANGLNLITLCENDQSDQNKDERYRSTIHLELSNDAADVLEFVEWSVLLDSLIRVELAAKLMVAWIFSMPRYTSGPDDSHQASTPGESS